MKLFNSRPEIFGLNRTHLLNNPYDLLPTVSKSFEHLQKSALNKGIHLKAVSTFRSFEAQKNIWNLKASGKRTLLNDNGGPINFNSLKPVEVMRAILRWSAFPGLSRHHWGTDLDVIDQNYLNVNPDYKVQLIPSEYQKGGPFDGLGDFLNNELKDSDFFRPYVVDRNGIAPEPWHLSHKSSVKNFDNYKIQDFLDFLNSSHCEDIELLEVVRDEAEFIFKNYFVNISSP
jgi:LAS superfamily LD-carboxypeptidase LdcB